MKHYEIHVTGKQGIHDPAGENSLHALGNLGYEGVTGVRIGKFIQLTAEDSVTEDEVREMCQRLLANPVIEDFAVSLRAGSDSDSE